MTEMRQPTGGDLKGSFEKLMKINLWGNRIDLSISGGLNVTQIGDPFAMIAPLEQFILANDIDSIWNALNRPNPSSTIGECCEC